MVKILSRQDGDLRGWCHIVEARAALHTRIISRDITTPTTRNVLPRNGRRRKLTVLLVVTTVMGLG
jgi:hypothetical protein